MNVKKRHWGRWTLAVLAVVFAAVLVAGFFYFDVPSWQSLDTQRLLSLAQTGSIYDKDGSFVTHLVGSENRTLVALEELPQHVVDAFLAAEDLRFYKHPGFDIVRIGGAVISNLRSGGYAQGASTITQQLVKLSHLSSQKTIARKLEEIWLALQLEHQFTKEEILEMYLNYIYFGDGAYGVQAAAQAVYGVDAKALSPAQAASLAAAIKAPSAYGITSRPDANRERRTYILNVMRQENMLSAEEYERAAAEELVPQQVTAVQLEYGWFVDAVLDEAEQRLDVTAETLLAGGYQIYTTMDAAMQATLEEQFTKELFPSNSKDGTKVQGASACLDTQNGAVRACVGGRDYATRRGLNRATQLRRQPGSSLKPLVVYAPAVQTYGYTPASVLQDEPTNFNGYKPRNSGYAYYGPVTVRTALKNSLNVCAVSLLNQIGIPAGLHYLQEVGIPLDDRDGNLSLALGSMTYGVSPVILAAAYSPFANGGIYYVPYFIEKITDLSGEVVYQHQPVSRQVLSTQAAYIMTDMLRTVTTSGTGAKLSTAGVQVAGKTGTVNMTGGGNRDVWMAAYTSEISMATWMGFDNPDSNHKLASRVSGGDNPAALCRDFFKAWYSGRTKPSFSKPDGIVTAEIDKKAIEWRGKPMLATELTPSAYRLKEVFIAGTQPTQKSDVWNAPRSARSFTVTHNEAGYPLLVIESGDNAVYRVQRDAAGESFVLTELYGTSGETLYFADTRAQAGVTYTYRVIPVHAELLQNGILLEGVQSVQVARASLPQKEGILEKFWNSVFGKEKQENEEEVLSIFAP